MNNNNNNISIHVTFFHAIKSDAKEFVCLFLSIIIIFIFKRDSCRGKTFYESYYN